MDDKKSTLYWFDKPLSYTTHSVKRSYERYVPPVMFLPLNAKFVEFRDYKYSFTYFNQIGKVKIVLREPGIVITTYYETPDKPKKIIHYKLPPKPREKKAKYPYQEIEDEMMGYA